MLNFTNLDAKIFALKSAILLDDNGTDIDGILDGLDGKAPQGGVFGEMTTAASTLGNGAYNLLFTVFIIVAVLSIIVIALMLLVGGSQTKAENKSKLVWAIVAIILATCAISIVKAIASGASTIFG